ncbi:MAG: zinc ribbon domain-containing protein [Armatimonadetes bacterium]|nr:zinc ribbon domain-containing protein [Anaerolineae bacterium]
MTDQDSLNPDLAPDERIADSKTYEMLWDCKACSTKKLLGKTHQFCPNCGSPQDPEWRYFPSDAEKVLAKDHVYVGADVICPACGSLNAGNVEFCRRCGAPQTDAAKARQMLTRAAGLTDALETEDLITRLDADSAARTRGQPLPSTLTPDTPTGGIKPWHLALIGVVILLIGGGLFTAFATREDTATVTGFRWERSIDIEQMSAVPGNSSCETTPLDAYAIDRRYEQVGSKQVADGETCSRRQIDQGDGTFREQTSCQTKYRSEPVMGYVCYYTVNRWVYARKVDVQGDKQAEPVWPQLNITRANCALLGCQREGTRRENYVLLLRRADKPFECAIARDVWDGTRLESRWRLQVGQVLNDERCDTLKPDAGE